MMPTTVSIMAIPNNHFAITKSSFIWLKYEVINDIKIPSMGIDAYSAGICAIDISGFLITIIEKTAAKVANVIELMVIQMLDSS